MVEMMAVTKVERKGERRGRKRAADSGLQVDESFGWDEVGGVR